MIRRLEESRQFLNILKLQVFIEDRLCLLLRHHETWEYKSQLRGNFLGYRTVVKHCNSLPVAVVYASPVNCFKKIALTSTATICASQTEAESRPIYRQHAYSDRRWWWWYVYMRSKLIAYRPEILTMASPMNITLWNGCLLDTHSSDEPVHSNSSIFIQQGFNSCESDIILVRLHIYYTS